MSRQLLIVYHTNTGGSRQMAEAAKESATLSSEGELLVDLQSATNTSPEDLLNADGYLFVTPETLASMAGLMKDFFDRCYYPALGQLEGRPYAQMICAGSDGAGAARQLERIATGWRLKCVQPALIVCTHAQTTEQILAPKHLDQEALAPCRELGALMGAGLAMGVL